MLASVSFGTRNTGLDVYYQILNSDKTVDVARTNTGVTELHPASGTFGVELDSDAVAGKTILWDVDGTDKTAVETFVNELSTITALRSAIWEATSRTLSAFDFDVVDEDAIVTSLTASLITSILDGMSLYQYLQAGPGNGSVRYEDTITTTGNHPVNHALVRAFAYDTGTQLIDFDTLEGSCTTEADGSYHLNLDPGTYARRVWKNGTVMLDDIFTVVAP